MCTHVGSSATVGCVSESVGVRQLRNEVSSLLRRVEAGELITVSVSGRPVAQLGPISDLRWTGRELVAELLDRTQADSALTEVLRELAGELLEDLSP